MIKKNGKRESKISYSIFSTNDEMHGKIKICIILPLLCASVVMILWLMNCYDANIIYGDAAGYSMMADELLKEGLFNFHLKLENGVGLFSIRGYGWPLVIAIIKFLGLKSRMGWIVWWSLFSAVTLAYIVPELFGEIFKKRVGMLGRLIAPIFTIVFWPGLLLYPLSDLPAITFAFAGILLIIRSSGKRILSQGIYLFFAGLLLQFSYYIRTGCLISLVVGIICLLLYVRCKKRPYKIICIICLLIGAYLAAMPQIIINEEHNGRKTWEVPINFTTGILDTEWYSGISTFRYETNISNQYPDAALTSHDNMAEILLENDNINPKEVGMRQVLFQIIRHPFEYLGIYMAKLVNYMDPRYGEVYLKKLYPFNYLVIITNYLIWFLLFVGIVYKIGYTGVASINEKGNAEISNIVSFFRKYFMWIICCIAPAIVHLAGTHVEPRYIYPIYLLVWYLMIMFFSERDYWRFVKNRMIILLLVFVLTFGVCWSIWNFTFEEFQYVDVFYQKSPEVYQGKDRIFDEAVCKQADVTVGVHECKFEDNKLTIWAYGFINEQDSENTKVSLLLTNDNIEYCYSIKTSAREDVASTFDEKYLKSGIYFSQYLWELEPGEYNMMLIFENGNKKHVYELGQKVDILVRS